MSWNFHGTLHMGSENLDYQMEKLRRRPHRQRVAAGILIGLAVVLAVVGFVHAPQPNSTATVVSYSVSPSGDVQVELAYRSVFSGSPTSTQVDVPPGWSPEGHPAGSTVRVQATTGARGSDPNGGEVVVIPRRHLVRGLLLGSVALLGALVLLAAARRNEQVPLSPDRRDYRLIPGPGMGKRLRSMGRWRR